MDCCWLVVSILTRPEGRVQPSGISTNIVLPCWSFNPHPSRRTGATNNRRATQLCATSFNPHPSRRTGATVMLARKVPRSVRFNPHPSRRTGATVREVRERWAERVSILTRPEGRVQPSACLPISMRVSFQSSPVPKDGCNPLRGVETRSSKARFNPHPSRRTGATKSSPPARPVMVQFQSSPVPKDGCNVAVRRLQRLGRGVSILTRPEGRVQRGTD